MRITDLELSLTQPALTEQVAVIDDRGVVRRWHTVGEWEQLIRADERKRCREIIEAELPDAPDTCISRANILAALDGTP